MNVSDDLICGQFIKGLPKNFPAVAASQPVMDLSQLGKLADDIMPYLNSDSK